MLVDTHCHLNDPSFAHSLENVIERAIDRDVRQFIVPAYDVESLARTAKIVSRHPGVLFPAYGIHPLYVNDRTHVESLLGPYLKDHGIVALGEIGLDFVPASPPADLQIRVLRKQLSLASDLGLPIIIHCRKAHDHLYSMLTPYKGSLRGVMHSYSGSGDLMVKFLDLGFFIAFSGSVTRQTARKYHKNATNVPFHRLLLETDAPSIATETALASLVEPMHMVEVAQKVADLRGITYHEVCRQSTQNAARLFGFPLLVTG